MKNSLRADPPDLCGPDLHGRTPPHPHARLRHALSARYGDAEVRQEGQGRRGSRFACAG